MVYELSDLIEIDKLQLLLESFFNITQIPSGILGIDGSLLVSAGGWRSICSEYHMKNEDCRRICKKSNEDLNKCKFGRKKYEMVECGNGLMYIVCPLIINKKHVANICQGQFLTEQPDTERFKNQARKYSFNENRYIEAVNKVPVISLERIEHIIRFLGQFAEMLGEMGLRQLTLMESQKKLNTSEECWEFVVDAMGDGVWEWNAGEKQPVLSEKCYDILGYPRDKIPRNYNSWMKCIHPEDREYVAERIKMHFRGSSPLFYCEYRLKGNDGIYKWMFLKGKMVGKSTDGKPSKVVGTMSDINHKKKMQQEAAELDMLKNEFLANISHELKTPINVIYSAAQLLDLYINSNSISENLEKIKMNQKVVKQNCYRSQRLINNLIDISRIDSGYFELRLINDNIVSAVEDIALSVKDYIEGNGIVFLFDTEIEEKVIAFDPEKIEKVILNLISNAVKFTEPGGTISICISEKPDRVVIKVQDTGAGIPADKLDVIFHRFKQVDGLFVRRSEGSGIGLTLVKSIIEMHGGRISVESECGKGSEFMIELPSRTVSQPFSSKKSDNINGNERGFIHNVNIEFSDIYSKK